MRMNSAHTQLITINPTYQTLTPMPTVTTVRSRRPAGARSSLWRGSGAADLGRTE
ncbi:hypothetical protein [Streptomyces fagopyri]|uniref:hypothetical protein n=1 Tax=Streptomyces fagopyri TaxID=2662397 RepID=UPI0033FABE40